MKSKIIPEICCEFCNEVIHNHFDCPVCKNGFAPTNIYGNFDEYGDGEYDGSLTTIIVCEKCKTEFQIMDRDGLDIEIEVKKEVKNERE